MQTRANPTIIADLQERIDKIGGVSTKQRQHLPFGVPEIGNRLPGGGLAFGCTHEIAGGGDDTVTGAVSAMFVAGIASRTKGPIVWCVTRTDLFAPALAEVGLDMNRVIFVESDNEDAAPTQLMQPIE